MISFTIPTNNLESEISALVSELQAKQEALKEAKKLEKQAVSAFEKLAATVEALKQMPEQLEALRASITALFPQPETAPVDAVIPDEPLPILEALQHVPTVETTPEQELTPPIYNAYTELRMLSDDVGYLVNKKGEVLAGYAGFTQKRKAEVKGKELSELLRMGYEVREEGNPKKRLPHKYELRLLDISMAQLQRLADELNPKQETPKPAIDLPEYTLIRDTSADSLLGQLWGVHGIGNDRRQYGTVREHLMHPDTWVHSKQRNINITYSSKEDAAKALVTEWANDRRLHNEMNSAIINRFMESEDPKTAASF